MVIIVKYKNIFVKRKMWMTMILCFACKESLVTKNNSTKIRNMLAMNAHLL